MKKWTLKGLRANSGLKAEEVTRVMGWKNNSSLSRVETDGQNLSYYFKERFAQLYGVPVEDIDFTGPNIYREQYLARVDEMTIDTTE